MRKPCGPIRDEVGWLHSIAELAAKGIWLRWEMADLID